MKLYVLFGQRHQRYAGQYGVEALACATIYDLDENSDYLLDKQDEYEETKDFSSLEIVTLVVDETKLGKILTQEKPILNVVILDKKE